MAAGLVGSDGRTDPAALGDLVERASGGDRVAQDELMRHYWPFILKVVTARLYRLPDAARRREEPCDVGQDAALRILRDLHAQGFRGRDQFRAWMKRVADASTIDRFRYQAAKRRSPNAEAGTSGSLASPPARRSPESAVDAERATEALHAALDALEPELAAAVWLHHEGYTYAEIADVLELNAEQVRKRIARAEVRLAALLEQG